MRTSQALQPPCGSVLECTPYSGELARHRVITSDGCDYVVATVREQRAAVPFVTGAYPVVRGYLVMMRQPLYEMRSATEAAAHDEHERLVRVLAEVGAKVVRARKLLAARQAAEKRTTSVALDDVVAGLRLDATVIYGAHGRGEAAALS
ncbi:MAG: hypothetical protein ACHQ4H_10490 [Ktedonobacterales bacterium]